MDKSLTFYFDVLKYGSYVKANLDSNTERKIVSLVKKLKLKNPVPVKELHTTLMYSPKAGVPTFFPYKDVIYDDIVVEGFRLLDEGTTLAIVFKSEKMSTRFEELSYLGMHHTYEDLLPHISLTYDYQGEKFDDKDLEDLTLSFNGEEHHPIRKD